MESIDNVWERIAALEQQTAQLKHQTQALARQARWWRGIACGVLLLGLVSLPLQSGTAADEHPARMGERMAAVEKKLSAMAFDDAANRGGHLWGKPAHREWLGEHGDYQWARQSNRGL